MKKTIGTLGLLAAIATGSASAQERPALVQMRELSPHEVRAQGFVLSSPQTLEIEAVGASENRERGWLNINVNNDGDDRTWRGNAWILNARTREVVWELRRQETDHRRKGVEQYDGRLQLPAGEYEAYYASYSALWSGVGNTILSVIGLNRRGREQYDDNGLSEGFQFVVRGDGRMLSTIELNRMRDDFRRDAIVTLTSTSREEIQQIGFSLNRPTAVEIYAIGEGTGEEAFDHGWIINADTRERVWKMEPRRSRHAGGASKNRVSRETRTLPAGRYAAVFAADDSHDPNDWNAAPPFDPSFWGLTLRVADAAARAEVKTFTYDPAPETGAIVKLTRIRDEETRSHGFTLRKPMDVRIYAMGEGTNGEMNDYGWVIDARTRKRVWTMEYDRTEHAGGAEKNRLAEQVIRLPAGSYLAYFKTDGSHSYRNWNSGAPIGGEDWGLSIYPASGTLEPGAVGEYQEVEADLDVIASLLNIGDDEARSRTFRLEEGTDLRVYALGEGDGDMYDYAWIENTRTGRTVWEMTYRLTSHAGGAHKNRLFDDVIHLPSGDYALRYRSDGSHSARGRFNADAPSDPERWGVTLFKVKD